MRTIWVKKEFFFFFDSSYRFGEAKNFQTIVMFKRKHSVLSNLCVITLLTQFVKPIENIMLFFFLPKHFFQLEI